MHVVATSRPWECTTVALLDEYPFHGIELSIEYTDCLGVREWLKQNFVLYNSLMKKV